MYFIIENEKRYGVIVDCEYALSLISSKNYNVVSYETKREALLDLWNRHSAEFWFLQSTNSIDEIRQDRMYDIWSDTARYLASCTNHE